jgi:hypothetical protein
MKTYCVIFDDDVVYLEAESRKQAAAMALARYIDELPKNLIDFSVDGFWHETKDVSVGLMGGKRDRKYKVDITIEVD